MLESMALVKQLLELSLLIDLKIMVDRLFLVLVILFEPLPPSNAQRMGQSRLDLEIVSGQHGADSAAVAYDAYSAGQSRGHDMVLIDTAGRLHVKEGLVEELVKLSRVLAKRNKNAPHHSWLVIDGSTGTNGLEQARVFNEKFGITGLVITKLDGTAKGGALVAIYR